MPSPCFILEQVTTLEIAVPERPTFLQLKQVTPAALRYCGPGRCVLLQYWQLLTIAGGSWLTFMGRCGAPIFRPRHDCCRHGPVGCSHPALLSNVTRRGVEGRGDGDGDLGVTTALTDLDAS